nr:WYL domain-containing protein [Rhizobium sp. Q54]
MSLIRTETFRRLIEEAIAERVVLFLRYHGVERTVEPHILGIVGHGRLALSGWQIAGTGRGWRLFHLDEVEELQHTSGRFSKTAIGYNPEDPSFGSILRRVEPAFPAGTKVRPFR